MCPGCGSGYKIPYMIKIHRTDGGVMFNKYIGSVGKDKSPGDGWQ